MKKQPIKYRVKILPNFLAAETKLSKKSDTTSIIDGYLASFGQIAKYDKKEAEKKARMFNGTIERVPALKVKKRRYKIWMVVEEITTLEDGSEVMEDIEEAAASASGELKTLKEANEIMDEIHSVYNTDAVI